jgi:hypothetical protein
MSNLDRVPKDFSSKPCGKGKEVGLLGRSWKVSHRGADTAFSGMVGPVSPRHGSSLIVHCRRGNCCANSVEIRLEQAGRRLDIGLEPLLRQRVLRLKKGKKHFGIHYAG